MGMISYQKLLRINEFLNKLNQELLYVKAKAHMCMHSQEWEVDWEKTQERLRDSSILASGKGPDLALLGGRWDKKHFPVPALKTKAEVGWVHCRGISLKMGSLRGMCSPHKQQAPGKEYLRSSGRRVALGKSTSLDQCQWFIQYMSTVPKFREILSSVKCLSTNQPQTDLKP